MATVVPLALGAVGPVGGFAIAGMIDRVPPQAALDVIGVSVVVGLAVALLLAWLSRSIAGTTIGTSAGFLLVSLWPTAASNAVDAGQGALMMLLLIPLIPVVVLLAWAGAKLAGDPLARAGRSDA